MIRVLLVDDHPILRQGLAGLLALEDDIEVVGEAVDGAAAVERAKQLRPDVVVMDLRLPVLSGAEATQQIMAGATDGWTPHVIVLTTYEDDDSITDAIEAGATGYLLKSAMPDEIVAAIRTDQPGALGAGALGGVRTRTSYARRHDPAAAVAPRTGSARADVCRPVERRDRREALRGAVDRQDAHRTHLHPARLDPPPRQPPPEQLRNIL
jgi:DNA-binding NarL/FixJ family response regulator